MVAPERIKAELVTPSGVSCFGKKPVWTMKKPPTETQGRCRGANNNIGQRGAMRENVFITTGN